jgi:ABC-type phosphate/phosphonate transport system permease subunit
MIQRKQTIFLILAACAFAVSFMFPIASFEAKAPLGVPVTGHLRLIAKEVPETMSQILNGEPVEIGQRAYVNTWPLIALTIVAALIALGSIFLYKNRVRQMRVVAVGFLLGVIDIFLVFIWAVDSFVDQATQAMAGTDVKTTYGIATWAMIVAIVLMFLAQRSIKKDEEKVRAADRLR